MKTTIIQWIVKLLQLELSYRTLKIATVIYFSFFLVLWIVSLIYLFRSGYALPVITGVVVLKGVNKIKSLKLIGKR